MTRVLAVTSPGVGHVFPLVPTLWAARGAGATVLVATTGAGVDAAAGSGLPVVDLYPEGGEELAELRTSFLHRMPGTPPEQRFALAMELFAALADRVADPAVALGRAWQPDVVVHTPLQPVGPLVAAVLGVPSVEHGFQLTGVLRTRHLLAPHLAAACARHGVAALPEPDVALDVCPPSMLSGPPRGRRLGFRPYSGGRAVPPAVLTPPGHRRRVVLTLGTSMGEENLSGALLDALAERDLDILVAGALPPGPTPPGVLAHGWLPLDTALPGCAALIHHGGAGSVLTGLAHGIPQVIVPTQADQQFNAAAVATRGAGTTTTTAPDEIAAALAQVLDEGDCADAAGEVAAEIAATPGPEAVIAPLLAELGRTSSTGHAAAPAPGKSAA